MPAPTNSFDSIETPAALVDLDRVDSNLRRVSNYCEAHGLAWRPHVKTHKTPALAVAQVGAGACGVTVATLREAEVMAELVGDLLLAYPVLGEAKRGRLRDLLGKEARVAIGLDSAEALAAAARAGREAGARVGVLVELDVGMHRVGVTDPRDAVALARRAIDSRHVEYRGVMFYPGHVRQVSDDDDPAMGDLTRVLGGFLEALEASDLPAQVVSGGSTPTLWHSHLISGLTEIRPGTNVFNDRTTVAAGACAWDECAYSILTTVVSTAVPGQAVVDAGSKALAREELRGQGGGFGALLDQREIVLRALSEEHGILDLSGTSWRPRIGDQLRVVPNHVCVSVNLQEKLWAVRNDQVVGEWEVAGRGRESAAGVHTAEGTRATAR